MIKQTEDYIGSNGIHRAQWLCECSCDEHNMIEVVGTHIRNGNTLSCGCLHKERTSNARKKYNEWLDKIFTDKNGDYRIGITSNTNKEFYIDAEDYDKVKDYCWCEVIKKKDGYHYLEARIPKENTIVRMNALLGFKNYDHSDRNPLNNRKYNLRQCSNSQNCMNRTKPKHNTSGIIGVTWNKKRCKWCAQMMINRKGIFLGYFTNKDDAIKARLQAERDYFGEFSPQ